MSAAPTGSTADSILTCARALLASCGHRELSMRRVAECAGVSATAIYRHFDGREALLAAVADRSAAELGAAVDRELDGGGTHRQRLVRALDEVMRFALERPQEYWLMFVPAEPGLGVGASQRARVFMRACVECLGQGAAVAHSGEGARRAAALWALSHGLLCLHLSGELESVASSHRAFARLYRDAIAAALAEIS